MASPTLAAQIQQVLAQHPGAKWIQWEPVNRDNARAGARTAFGQYVEPLYDLTKADVILSLDADFLSSDGAHNLTTCGSSRRAAASKTSADNLNRLYVVESDHTVTGGRADHRLPLKSSQIEAFARAVAAGAGVSGVSGAAPAGTEAFAAAVAKDLAASQGPRGRDGRRCAAARGARDRARDQRRDRRAGDVSADAGNRAVGTKRRVLRAGLGHQRRPRADAGDPRRIEPGVQRAGRLQVRRGDAQGQPASCTRALFFDETARYSHWHIPAAHYLEAWSDARTIDGTVSIVQPLIQPLYGGKSAHEMIATMSDRPERDGYDVVREYWQAYQAGLQCRSGATAAAAAPVLRKLRSARALRCSCRTAAPAEFEKPWRKWLHDGFIARIGRDRAARRRSPWLLMWRRASDAPATPIDGIEINFRRDPTIYDGRYANNGWLQELPKPMIEADVGQRRAHRAGDRGERTSFTTAT